MYFVGVAPKKPDHPWYNQGSKLAYTFNGEEGKTLNLVRGKRYTFNINTPGHPFYFTTDSRGGNGDYQSLMNKDAIDNGIITFDVTDDLPTSFYYQCQRHPKMGGKVNIVERDELLLSLV